MVEGEFYAIEPFITTGNGESILKEPNSHFMLTKNIHNIKNLNKDEKKIYDIIDTNYSTLPFCQKWLYQLNSNLNYDIFLDKL
jgi:methionyl aminopeptidase